MKSKSQIATVKFTFLLILAMQPLIATAQPPPVKQLKEVFPNEDVIIENSNIVYEFSINEVDQTLEVTEKIQHTFLSLKPKVSAPLFLYYDSYSIIEDRIYYGDHIRRRDVRSVCGDFERENIFHHDVKVCRFNLPFENRGHRVIFEATKKFLDVKYFTTIPLHYQYGSANLNVTIQIPSNITVDLHEMNLEGMEFTTSEIFNEENQIREIRYNLQNLPPTLNTQNLPQMQCYLSHLKIQTRHWESQAGEVHEVMHQKENLYNWYVSLVTEPEISPQIAELTDRLINDAGSEEEKMATLLGWVQNNIRYIAFLDGLAAFVPDTEAEVLRKRYGDCKGKANLLRAMLTHAGFDARLAWVYTGTYCYHDSILSLAQHNHMICAVKQNDTFIFLDPTVKYHTIHEVPPGIHGKLCIIEDGEKGWLEYGIPETGINENNQQSETMITLEGDKMRLRGQIILTGIEKFRFQHFISSLPRYDKDHFIRYFLTGLSNRYEIIEVNHSPVDEATEKFTIDYEMLVSNAVISVGDDKIFPVNFTRGLREEKIEPERIFNYDVGFGRRSAHHIRLTIPEGYRIKNIPGNLAKNIDVMEFLLQYNENEETLYVTRKFGINSPIIQPVQFSQWNNLIDILAEAYREMVVITRSETIENIPEPDYEENNR